MSTCKACKTPIAAGEYCPAFALVECEKRAEARRSHVPKPTSEPLFCLRCRCETSHRIDGERRFCEVCGRERGPAVAATPPPKSAEAPAPTAATPPAEAVPDPAPRREETSASPLGDALEQARAERDEYAPKSAAGNGPATWTVGENGAWVTGPWANGWAWGRHADALCAHSEYAPTYAEAVKRACSPEPEQPTARPPETPPERPAYVAPVAMAGSTTAVMAELEAANARIAKLEDGIRQELASKALMLKHERDAHADELARVAKAFAAENARLETELDDARREARLRENERDAARQLRDRGERQWGAEQRARFDAEAERDDARERLRKLTGVVLLHWEHVPFAVERAASEANSFLMAMSPDEGGERG